MILLSSFFSDKSIFIWVLLDMLGQAQTEGLPQSMSHDTTVYACLEFTILQLFQIQKASKC